MLDTLLPGTASRAPAEGEGGGGQCSGRTNCELLIHSACVVKCVSDTRVPTVGPDLDSTYSEWTLVAIGLVKLRARHH